jgi:hypothetical protein
MPNGFMTHVYQWRMRMNMTHAYKRHYIPFECCHFAHATAAAASTAASTTTSRLIRPDLDPTWAVQCAWCVWDDANDVAGNRRAYFQTDCVLWTQRIRICGDEATPTTSATSKKMNEREKEEM